MFLNCHSYHSLRYGTLSISTLVNYAAKAGVQTLVLTDINAISGIYDFKKVCEAAGIKPVVGVEVRNQQKLLYIAIAKEFSGIGEVNQLLTDHHCHEIPLSERAPDFQKVWVVYPLNSFPETLRENEFIGVREEELNQLIRPHYQQYLDKMVMLNPITFQTKKDYNLHRILRAIDLNTLISKLEPQDICSKNEYFKSADEVVARFKAYPLLIQNTEKIIHESSFEFDFKVSSKTKKHFTDSKENDVKLLEKLAFEGLQKRYPNNSEQAEKRIRKELEVIDKLNFCAYFLITWDIVQYSNRMGFMHVGRGSGANSIVSYCLGITDICPLELDLYFERFLNLNRETPPDFDIDWSWQHRNQILDYIFEKYGRNHVAFCGTNVEFKYRSIFREIGKVFGLPKEELDEIANPSVLVHHENKLFRLIEKYGKLLDRFPNQRSMHACGILISEEPITQYSILELPPKGYPIVQFDMYVAEEIGLEKFDILSQRGLGSIKDAVDLIEEKCGVVVDIQDTSISKNEALCNNYLSQGKTLGCFYIESPAMRGLLRKLKCDNYKVLVAASSIIRPGVAKSGMMREYILRHNHAGQFEYFHDVFKEQLGETYGIMVYQEDVIKIALYFGGLSAANGDILRRAMSGKGRSLSELQKVKDDFLTSCKALGHSEELSKEVYRQIESFAGYSFCKAHSASYAVESYQSLYLKVYYPIEFMVAVINNQGGFYRTEVYVHEAKMSGAKINNPCVNRSLYTTTLYGNEVYLGFMHLEKLDAKTAQIIAIERQRNGDYTSLENFLKRIPIGIETLQILIFIGAFRIFGKAKYELLIEARFLVSDTKYKARNLTLIEEPLHEYSLPKMERHWLEDGFDELEILGFTVSCTPFDLLQTQFRGKVTAKTLSRYHRKEVKMVAYLIARKYVPTSKGVMNFGTWIDVEGNYFDTSHFPDALSQYPFLGNGCYLLLGVVDVDFNFPTLTVHKMARLPYIEDPRYNVIAKKHE